MRKHHPKNERIKRHYLAYLEEAKRMSPKSTDQVAAAIVRFEASTDYRDFAQFHIEQARRFKRQFTEEINPDDGQAARQGDGSLPADGAQGLRPLVGGPARLQVANQLFRRRVLQPVGQ
jgi:hypothetical protein